MRNGKDLILVDLCLARETELAFVFLDEDKPTKHLWVAKKHAHLVRRHTRRDGNADVSVMLPRWLANRWKLL